MWRHLTIYNNSYGYKILSLLLIDLSLTVMVATLIFISGRGAAISSAKEGKSGFIYNLVKSYKLFGPQTCVHFVKILELIFINP